MKVRIPISPGELLDKITILKIKQSHVPDAGKLAAIERELKALNRIREAHPELEDNAVRGRERQLYAQNRILWSIEDQLRALERKRQFGKAFVALARRVYLANDKRARLKREINDLLGSSLREEKWFSRK